MKFEMVARREKLVDNLPGMRTSDVAEARSGAHTNIIMNRPGGNL